MTLTKFITGLLWFFGTLLLLCLFSCSKPAEQDRCYFACLLSDKYTADSIFVVRDTIWKDECLTKHWYDKTKAASDTMPDMFRHCTPFARNGYIVEKERLFYVMGRVNVEPRVY